ncbi:MAG: hypothetical protein PHV06_10330, partial [bacterium]|nr:hypothetical protein [bacterium]
KLNLADFVISCSDYKKTLLKLLDDRTPLTLREIKALEKAKVSESFFTVYLGLNMKNEELRSFLKIPHVILSDIKKEKDFFDASDRDFFKHITITLYSPSLINPDLAPEGKSSLMIQAMSPHEWMNNWGGGDRNKYLELKEAVKNQLIGIAEKLIPDLSGKIIFSDAATPLTYERFTHNTEGASSAWNWDLNLNYFKNLYDFKITTPVLNLLIGSCWSNPLGGIPGAIAGAYESVKYIEKNCKKS